MDRDRIINFIDGYLDSKSVKDASLNGLQVEGKPEVKKIVFGVSASLELFRRAAAAGADMIVVHHGLFWGRSFPVRGPFRKKMETLLDGGITLAAWHLPLDKHPVAGNTYDGESIGFRGAFSRPRPVSEVIKTLRDKLSADILSLNFGPKKIRTVGVVSGGAARMFEQAVEAGLDLYITGECSEFVQEMARENGANFVAAGHYNTEKAGVWALEKIVRAKFKVRTEFIDVPNPV
jgi:dinuclear metal center YbgI/SA1388 family protein